jgi:phage replication O-like protein O
VSDRPYRFGGFSSPNYTQTPNDLFDELLPELSESELKVLLYVIRRTFGFGKEYDAISINQLAEGITTRDGRQLDRGTGLSRTSVKKATASLVEKGVLTVRKVRSEEGDYESNVFTLRLREVGQNVPYPRSESDLPVGQNMTLQEKDVQKREEQQLEDSKGTPASIQKYSADRDVLANYITDFSHEFADRASLASSISRAQNLYQRSGLSLDQFVEVLYAARAITKERSANVREVPDESGRKSRMHYYFAVVEDLLEQTLPATGTGND